MAAVPSQSLFFARGSKSRFTIAIFALALLWTSNAFAATINAASCSQSAVQAAVNTAVDGDKVAIPSGTCAWSGGIGTTKQIMIEAQNYTPTPKGTMTRNATGFEIRSQAWDYLSEAPITGKVGYLVMEKGSRTLANGIQVEAGLVNTNKTGSFGSVAFAKPFSVAPVVITGVTSVNEASAVATRVKNVSTTGFYLEMQEQEANPQVHATETISYIAWQPSSGTVEGQSFQVGKTASVVTDQFYTLNYPKAIATLPVFLADMQTTNGSDTANLRWQNRTLSSIQVKVAEEQSSGSETRHGREAVGYILLTPQQ
jgi:hypothetical protein